jgi:hypothetical protein
VVSSAEPFALHHAAIEAGPAARATGRPVPRRFDLIRIEAALRQVQQAFPRINPDLRDRRDPMDDQVVANLMAGYAEVDALVAAGIDPFAMGNLKYLLELNALVLCGTEDAARAGSIEHLRATEERFYGEDGIRGVIDWHEAHRLNSVWKRSAGVFTRVMSEPQLFLEGNHRTGTLIVSWLLAREGRPPLVLTPATARAFFDPASLIKKTRKRGLVSLFRTPGLKKRFARFLKAASDERYLVSVAAPASAVPS